MQQYHVISTVQNCALRAALCTAGQGLLEGMYQILLSELCYLNVCACWKDMIGWQHNTNTWEGMKAGGWGT